MPTPKKGKGILEGIEREVKTQAAWQKKHEKENAAQFKKLSDTLATLPSKEENLAAIAGQIKITVNGKIDDIKAHLDRQDEAMATASEERTATKAAIEELSKKIKPLDTARTWATDGMKVVVWVAGTVAALSAGVAGALYLIGLIH